MYIIILTKQIITIVINYNKYMYIYILFIYIYIYISYKGLREKFKETHTYQEDLSHSVQP